MKMASHRRSKHDKSSIKYWWVPLEVQSFDLHDICSKGDDHKHSVSHTKIHSQSKAKSPVVGITTSKLVSAAAGLWDFVGHPAVFQTKESLIYDDILKKGNGTCYSHNQKKTSPTLFTEDANACNDIKSKGCLSSTARSNFEDLKKLRKLILFASCNRNINSSIISSNPLSHVDSSGIDEVASVEVSGDRLSAYRSIDMKKVSNFIGREDKGREGSSIVEERPPTKLSSIRSVERDDKSEAMVSSGDVTMRPKVAIVVLRNPSSIVYSTNELSTSTNCETNFCNITKSSTEESKSEGHNGRENVKSLFRDLVTKEECSSMKQLLSTQDKFKKAFAKNKHAIAGALAGTLVSLCLHPVDTVKTVIQANSMGQNSSYDILRTILSEKGVLGLYRGIASNIASSAPISAIYTFTYESVKGTLVPLLPKEYHSFAHCVAGGCSSIATSFIFTPSECIKQQMQVGSQYQNCWNALIGCIEKGGVTSLYAGWGAVLCRNIPHSIIKFYTYERLKQLLLTSTEPGSNLSTLQTLVCGGLAGSTAALSTTPFDVVKTRLQTQVPGSLARYNGVLHALQEIARQEGLQGLYRGLTPRLAMYVSQGAIFFASYEFLKAVFSMEVQSTHIVVVDKDEVEADNLIPPRIQKLH